VIPVLTNGKQASSDDELPPPLMRLPSSVSPPPMLAPMHGVSTGSNLYLSVNAAPLIGAGDAFLYSHLYPPQMGYPLIGANPQLSKSIDSSAGSPASSDQASSASPSTPPCSSASPPPAPITAPSGRSHHTVWRPY
jgi:hypothetical protein